MNSEDLFHRQKTFQADKILRMDFGIFEMKDTEWLSKTHSYYRYRSGSVRSRYSNTFFETYR